MDNYKIMLEQMTKKEVMAEFNRYITLQVTAKQLLKNTHGKTNISYACILAVQDIVNICNLSLHLIKDELAKRGE